MAGSQASCLLQFLELNRPRAAEPDANEQKEIRVLGAHSRSMERSGTTLRRARRMRRLLVHVVAIEAVDIQRAERREE